jgi:glycosyltransferase domain-containing protein
MKQNELITIFIPTYNRPGYLKRLLGYYNDCRIAHQIIIADGSSDEIKKANREMVSSFPSLKVLHLHAYSPETPPIERIVDALKHVDTGYCVFCADDDFITPNGINQARDFLANNPDYTAAHGQYISFFLKDDENGKQQFHWRPTPVGGSIIFQEPEVRLSRHLSQYTTTSFYAVHRTELMKFIWAETVKTTQHAHLSELLLSMLTLIYGKMKCLEVLYAARDESTAGKWQTLPEALKEGTYDAEYARFRDCLAYHLNKQSQLSLAEAGEVVDRAMAAYMKKYYFTKKRFTALTTTAGKTLDHLHLPRWLDGGIRNTYRKLTGAEYCVKDSIDLSPSSIYYKDIDVIRRHVLSWAVTNSVP